MVSRTSRLPECVHQADIKITHGGAQGHEGVLLGCMLACEETCDSPACWWVGAFSVLCIPKQGPCGGGLSVPICTEPVDEWKPAKSAWSALAACRADVISRLCDLREVEVQKLTWLLVL